MFFLLCTWNNPQNLARAFGARGVFKVILLGEAREKRAIREPARLAYFQFSHTFVNERSFTRPNPGEIKWFFNHVDEQTLKFCRSHRRRL